MGMSRGASLVATGGGPLPRGPGFGAVVPHLFGLILELGGPGLCLGLKGQRAMGLWHPNTEGLGVLGLCSSSFSRRPRGHLGSGEGQTQQHPPARGKLLVPGCSWKPLLEKCLLLGVTTTPSPPRLRSAPGLTKRLRGIHPEQCCSPGAGDGGTGSTCSSGLCCITKLWDLPVRGAGSHPPPFRGRTSAVPRGFGAVTPIRALPPSIAQTLPKHRFGRSPEAEGFSLVLASP